MLYIDYITYSLSLNVAPVPQVFSEPFKFCNSWQYAFEESNFTCIKILLEQKPEFSIVIIIEILGCGWYKINLEL